MNPLTIALPKGRLLEPAVALFHRLGYDCPLSNGSRQLLVEDGAGHVQFLLAKPGDVAVYVEYGAADLGIVGQDVLLESGRDVYEPLPLGFGRCRLVLAGVRSMLRRWIEADTEVGGPLADSRAFPSAAPERMKGVRARPSPPPPPRRSGEGVLTNALAAPPAPRTTWGGKGVGGEEGRAPCPSLRDRPDADGAPLYGECDLGLLGSVRVATRYPNVTRAYFRQRGVPIEIVHLSGSIELAPSVGLADLVVDVVETGRTLRANGLVELAEVARCQATTVVNRVAHRLRRSEIRELLAAIQDAGGAR